MDAGGKVVLKELKSGRNRDKLANALSVLRTLSYVARALFCAGGPVSLRASLTLLSLLQPVQRRDRRRGRRGNFRQRRSLRSSVEVDEREPSVNLSSPLRGVASRHVVAAHVFALPLAICCCHPLWTFRRRRRRRCCCRERGEGEKGLSPHAVAAEADAGDARSWRAGR
jgi:hypothetical protein